MYDIRGLVDEQINEGLSHHIGRAFASLISREQNGKPLTIVVGRDMRASSIKFEKEVVAGLVASGCTVLMVGLVSTPAFYFSVGHLKADGGIMVSASHNPAAYNGFKMVRANAIPVSGMTGIEDLATMIEREDYIPESTGSVEEAPDMPRQAVEMEMAHAGADVVTIKKVVVDSANGMGAQYLDLLFQHLGVDVERMFWDLDGSFPNHEADPFKPENRQAIEERMKQAGADLGITTDGDGDRMFFVDEKGETVDPAIIRGLIAQIELRRVPGATICYDIRPGKITEDMIVEAGGVPSVTRVGHSLIKEQMRKVGAIFGGESSGHFYYKFPIGVFEGPVCAALEIMQEISRQGKPFSEIVAPLKRYVPSGEINRRVADKQAVLDAVKKKHADAKILEIDGVSMTYPNVWFNLRPSNTEPLIRLNVEAVDQATMEKYRDELLAMMV